MKRFLDKHADKIIGVLSGFDRLVFRGTLRALAYADGLKQLLWKRQVLLKDFGAYAEAVTKNLKQASLLEAHRLKRPVQYLPSGKTDKEAVARDIMEKDKIKEGLIAVLTCLELCYGYDIYRNRDLKKLELVLRPRKCLFLYHYMIDPVFGFMSARIQSWIPFNIQVCVNGREWLSRQMDREGLSYRRRDNCFVSLENIKRSQTLMDSQVRKDFPKLLNRIARILNPAHGKIFKDFPQEYYWSVYQNEWATDVMFRDIASLQKIYPSLVLHAMTSFSSPDVMRFLGRKTHTAFQGEIVSDFKDRAEGIRVKHRVDGLSIKMYDKWSDLRIENTWNNPDGFKVFRTAEGNEDGPPAWRPLRRGVADIHRRCYLSQAANERYLDALASADTSVPLGNLVKNICRPTIWKNKRVRALRPWDQEDTKLFATVNRGEFAINGFRNRDLQTHLYDHPATSPEEKRRRSARVSRLLRMLRAHGLIAKVPHSHRYMLTQKGREIIPAILTSQRISMDQLQKLAA